MRWHLGRSNAKKKAATSRGVDVAPTNRAASITTPTIGASGTNWQRSGASSDAHETSTTGADGEMFCYATSSCLGLRRRSANSARANGAVLRTTDSLASSFVSFVEGFSSQPRRQSSSAGDAHCSPSSTGPDAGSCNGDGANVSCGGADTTFLCTVDGSVDGGRVDSSSNTAAATTMGTAMS